MVVESLANFVTWTISHIGYWGVFILMFFEAACIPVPSEVIMPFSGFLVVSGRFAMWQVALIGSLGDLSGSIFAYYIGYVGGRPLVEKYGRYIFINHKDLDRADHFFQKYGEATAFFSRMIPVVRTFISLPAGIAKMDFKKFVVFTFLGALPFSFALTWAGVQLGKHWDEVRQYLHRFDIAIIVIMVLFIGWWILRHVKSNHKSQKSK